MKREATRIKVSPIWPLFAWELCSICCLEFRREWGWYVEHHYRNGCSYSETFCRECAPTPEDAMTAFQRHCSNGRA